jgi:type III secretion protein W
MTDSIRANAQESVQIATEAAAGAAAAPVQGQFRGDRVVQLPSQTSMIEDALEELTETQSEKEEKDISEREVDEGRLADQLERILALEKIKSLMSALKDLRKGDMTRALAQLLRFKNATPRQLQERARQAFKDPSHQYALLSALAEALKGGNAPKGQVEAAEKALQGLMEEQGPSIRAGINVTAAAEEASVTGLGDVQGLRDAYRDAVLDYQGIQDAYAALIDRYGAGKLNDALAYLKASLAADMAAAGSSIDKTRLNAIIDDIFRLELLSGMLEDCGKLADQVHAWGAHPGLGAADLLKEVIALQQDKWLRPEQVRPLPRKAGLRDIDKEIGFLRELKELMRRIPIKAYEDPGARQRLIEAVQLAMDDAIDREEQGADA